jgi:hypothetical protein
VARRRPPPPVTEPPSWVRCFEPDRWSDWTDGADGERVHRARQRWNAARFGWCRTNGVDPLDLLREQAEAKRRLA